MRKTRTDAQYWKNCQPTGLKRHVLGNAEIMYGNHMSMLVDHVLHINRMFSVIGFNVVERLS